MSEPTFQNAVEHIHELKAERDALARRITRLRGEMGDALIHCSKGCNWPLDLVPGCHPCQILSDALSADDEAARR